MKFAVLLCVYSGDKVNYFHQAYNSIVQQNKVCVDNINIYLHIDGLISKEMEMLIDTLNFHRIVRSPKSVGLAKGLNKLIAMLEDEKYIYRMDADDIAHKDRFYLQGIYLDNNMDIDVCGGSIAEFNGDLDNIVYIRNYPIVHGDIYEKLIKSSPLAHVTVCFRRDFFNKFGGYPTSFGNNEDIAYWYKSLSNGAKFGNLKEILCYVRMDSAYGRRSIGKSFSEFKIYSSIALSRNKLPIYAIARLIFRLMPTIIIKFIYNNPIRNVLLR